MNSPTERKLPRLTPWFVGGIKPRRAGVYRVKWNVCSWMGAQLDECTAYAYWSRRLGWRQFCSTPKEALRRNHYPGPVQGPIWRGLTLAAYAIAVEAAS